MDMLHKVSRDSIDIAPTAAPRYSITCPCAPPVPIRPIMASATSLADTPSGRSPCKVTAIARGLANAAVWVASTCSTWLVPMPNARAPKAPWVLVWLSPQRMIRPGWVIPSSGPITWTMPCPAVPDRCSGTPNSAQLRRSAATIVAATPELPSRPRVGTTWSSVARVSSGRRTVRPARRRPSNACGLDPSCSRWKST